jgi:hypothetical protein
MRSVGYSPMLTFNSGIHRELKAFRQGEDLVQSVQELALEPHKRAYGIPTPTLIFIDTAVTNLVYNLCEVVCPSVASSRYKLNASPW